MNFATFSQRTSPPETSQLKAAPPVELRSPPTNFRSAKKHGAASTLPHDYYPLLASDLNVANQDRRSHSDVKNAEQDQRKLAQSLTLLLLALRYR